MTERPYVAYADFNCPFCFALSERLVELGLHSAVEWRPIQHLRDAPEPAEPLTSEELAELQEELERLGPLEPALAIRNSNLRPNTRTATLAVMAIRRVDPDNLWKLISGIYRALWRQGRDISDKEVIDAVAADCGIQLPEGFERRAAFNDDASVQQTEWEAGGFDRRLPVMQSPHGTTLLGLGSRERTRLFIESGRISTSYGDEVCVGDSD